MFCQTIFDIHLPANFVFMPYLSFSAALPLCDAEQRQPGGPNVYWQPQPTPRGQAT